MYRKTKAKEKNTKLLPGRFSLNQLALVRFEVILGHLERQLWPNWMFLADKAQRYVCTGCSQPNEYVYWEIQTVCRPCQSTEWAATFSPLRSILLRLPLYVGNGGCSLYAHTFKMRKGFHNIRVLKKERNPNNLIFKEQRHFRAASAADKMFPKQTDPDNPSFCRWREPSDQVKR